MKGKKHDNGMQRDSRRRLTKPDDSRRNKKPQPPRPTRIINENLLCSLGQTLVMEGCRSIKEVRGQ